jgi:hypothetical protein
MVFRGMVTAHYPHLDVYNCDAANTIPAVLSEALVYTRPGVLELLPALPYQIPIGSISGVRGRNRVHVRTLSWNTTAGTATVTLTSDLTQDITLICRRGIDTVSASVPVAASPLGGHARVVSLTAGSSTQITIGLSPVYKLVNHKSGMVLDVNGAGTSDGTTVIQWPWSGSANQRWILRPNADGSRRVINLNSMLVLDSPGGSGQGADLDQWIDTGSDNQAWNLVPAATSGYSRLVNVRTGWCADVDGGSTTKGANIIQWPADGGANQEWQLVAL